MARIRHSHQVKGNDNLILIGFASSGKTVVGKKLASLLGMRFVDLDKAIENLFENQHAESLSCREIFKKYGETYFRQLEGDALKNMTCQSKFVLATGGGTPMQAENRQMLTTQGIVIYLAATPDALCYRFQGKGAPAYLENDPSIENVSKICEQRDKVYRKLADHTIDTSELNVEGVVSEIMNKLGIKC